MQGIWKFLTDNKDALTVALAIVSGVLGVLWGAWKLFLERWWKNRIRIDVKVFEVITDPAHVLPKLYSTENDNSPLADHNIKYQPRDSKLDIQAQLKTTLNRSRYLLVTAPTGYGKTREAGMLAQTMMLEGWRILHIKTGWLDIPKELPEELNGNRSRVLVFLDDLNGLFSTGELTQSPRAEQMPILTQVSYHDRLMQVLDMLEGMCTENEIRVIATARSETEQWKLLGFDVRDKLWKRFERIELSEPENSAIVDLLDNSIKQADMTANPEEYEVIARKSDGTYRNILLNLRRWQALNKKVSKDDFTETLDGSWQDIYERAVNKHPAVKYVYDAMDILQQTGIELFSFLVEPTALAIWDGNYFQKILYKRQIKRVLQYLTRETKILRFEKDKLAPSDGQIESRGHSISWIPYLLTLKQLILVNSSKKIYMSIVRLAEACYGEKKYEDSYQLTKKHIELVPLRAPAYFLLGTSLYNLQRYDEADAAFHKAIELDPLYTDSYLSLGDMLTYRLKRYVEAEASYRKAMELDPSNADAYLSLGNLLSDEDLTRYDEAEAAYRKAIELNPSHATAYSNLGNTLNNLKRYDEAEGAYRKAIELNPSDATAYYNLGILLRNLKRYEEAEGAYRKAIELNPSDATAYSNLGNTLNDLKRYDEAEAAYRKAIELNPSDATAYYNLGILLRNLKRYEEAEAAYRKAIELNPSDATAYSNLGNTLKDLKRYDEAEAAYRKAIELNPSHATAYYNLGILLRNLKRYDEAEGAYRKAIELNPSDATAYSNLAILLRVMNKERDTLPILEKTIEINPEDFNSYLGIASIKKTLGESIESSFIEKARRYIPEDDFYNRACLESVCDNFELAFEHLQRAAQKEKFNPAWAWEDPDLQWIRDDSRFVEIVGPKPENKNSEN